MQDEFDPDTGELFDAPATNGAGPYNVDDWIAQKSTQPPALKELQAAGEQIAKDGAALTMTHILPPASTRAGELVEHPNPQPLGGRGLDEALFRAQGELPCWIKAQMEGQVGPRKYKYASLAAILSVVRPVFAAHGIRIRQGADRSWPMDEGGGQKGRLVPVWTELVHTPTGERERTTLEMPLPKMDPQGMGSAVSYGRRYSLLAAIGLASDEADDDGASARRPDVTSAVEESAELISLKDEVDKMTTVPALVAWGANPKTRRAVDELSEGEAVLLRQWWSKRARELRAAIVEGGTTPAAASAATATTKRKPKEPST